jgi:VanZ family protein
VIYAAGIFIVSSLSKPPMPPGLTDKSGHALAYAGFGALVLRALAGAELTGVTVGSGAAAVALATAYGASDELHQLFVPERTADLRDLGADAMGATAGVAAAWLALVLGRRRKSRI